MKVLIFSVTILGLFAGCSRNSAQNPRNWFVQSFENGQITVVHEGNTYKAICEGSWVFNSSGTIANKGDVIEFQDCNLAVELVGSHVQPFDGRQKEADGWIVNMWNVGSTLAVQRRRDQHTPWRLEEFKVVSVRRARGPTLTEK